MVDYTYYKEVFGGMLTEREFLKVLPKAKAYLRGATHGRALPEHENVRFCLAELCELFSQKERSRISTESVDGFRVTYRRDKGDPAWEIVRNYLVSDGLLYGGGRDANL